MAQPPARHDNPIFCFVDSSPTSVGCAWFSRMRCHKGGGLLFPTCGSVMVVGPCILPFSSCYIGHDMPILCFVLHQFDSSPALVGCAYFVPHEVPLRWWATWSQRRSQYGLGLSLALLLHTNLPPSSWIKSRFGIEILCLILCVVLACTTFI